MALNACRAGAAALTSLVLAGCGVAAAATRLDPAVPPPGTYEVSFCPGGCGAEGNRPVAGGTLVLQQDPFSMEILSDSARTHFQLRTAMLLIVDARRAPNACFALTRLAPRAMSHAGLEAAGLTRWESVPDSGVFRVTLYRSPDAFYVAYLTSTRDGLRGRGESWGGGAERGSVADDSVVARRIGPPDPAICGRAAEAEAAAVRTRQ